MAKSPSFQFYPGDWLRNDVSGCSLEAQGLWLRLMIIMHDAQIYGQLVLNNAPMPPEFVAKKIGISCKKYSNLLAELDFAGVINRKENGIIYSGRMERDEILRQQNRERQGRYRDNHPDESNGKVTDDVTHPSRSGNGNSNGALHSSSSTTTTTAKKPKLSDSEWLESLQQNSAYEKLEIKTEYAKAEVWCEANSRQCTRRFFVGWLNRAKPMRVAAEPKRKPAPSGNGSAYVPTDAEKKDMMSPYYEMPPRPITFDDIISMQRSSKDEYPEKWMSREMYETAKAKYTEKYPEQIERYEHSIEFRQRFGEAG